MFILKNRQQLENAINKARRITPKLKIKVLGFGHYLVESESRRGFFNQVRCGRLDNGKKYVDCECRAGRNGVVCKHAVIAIGAHTVLAEKRREQRSKQPNLRLAAA